MLKQLAAATFLIALTAVPIAAQGRSQRGQIPPGHMPRPGECRVWHDGRPPGQQPRPTSCAEAQRVAARTGGRVIYGGNDGRVNRGSGGVWRGESGGWPQDSRRNERDRRDRDDDDDDDDDDGDDDRIGRDNRRGTDGRRPTANGRDTQGRAIPRTSRYPTTTRDGRVESAGYENGYRDGVAKGHEDANLNRQYDPDRHAWYRSADRGYNSRYGSRETYRTLYRSGFVAGYDDTYDGRSSRTGRSRPWWWPF